MQTLADRLAQPDMASLADWQAAALLNKPDESLPVVIEWEPTQIGLGSILATLGAVGGANLLTQIKNGAAENPVLEWGLRILDKGNFDLSLSVTRDTIDSLMQAGMITQEQRDAVFNLSRRARHKSWAEAHDMVGKVTARDIGIARGAEP